MDGRCKKKMDGGLGRGGEIASFVAMNDTNADKKSG